MFGSRINSEGNPMKTTSVMGCGRWAGLLCAGWIAAGTASAQPPSAPGMMGAQKVLEAVAKAVAVTNAVAPADESSQNRDRFKADLDRFRTDRTGMAPEKAAAEWLSLFDRFWKLPPDSPSSARMMRGMFGRYGEAEETLSLHTVVAALPEPSAWEALAAAVEKRTTEKAEGQRFETSLRLLVDCLTGSTEKIERDVAAFESQIADLEEDERERIRESLQDLRRLVERRRQGGTAEDVMRQLEKALAFQKTAKKGSITLKLPDLVPLVGGTRAESLIVAALETPGVRLEIDSGEDTMALARRLCLECVDKLLEPQWALVNSPDAVALYEGLARKFPPHTSSEQKEIMRSEFIIGRGFYDGDDRYAAREAKGHYVAGLLVQNRAQDAFAFVTGLPKDELYWVQETLRESLGFTGSTVSAGALFDFCGRLVKTKEGNLFWYLYIDLGLQMGKTSELLDLLAAEAARTDLAFSRQIEACVRLATGYLAADRVDDAVRVMRRVLQMDASGKPVDEQAAFEIERMAQAFRLANLGRLLDKPEWVEEGTEAVERALAKEKATTKRGYDLEPDYRGSRFWRLLMDEQQYAKAEAFLVDAIAAKLKNDEEGPPYRDASESLSSELTQLAEVYYRAGRHGDILELLEKAPWWGVEDLVDLRNSGGDAETSLAVMAAAGLRSAGRTAEAAAILKDRIHASPGDDDAYALLIEMSQEDLVPWLDALYQRDRFEERPLIWKAHLLMKAGKLDEAEAVILEALRVDPTDGETQAGNRVRAYAVMSEIKAAQGKKDDAKFFADVVESVKIAEHGDKLTGAGLTTRSIAVYEKAQGYFADAYCVQWRLAKRLDELGKKEEAEKHYRIAFERMPEQFGQVASFCFGCEGAFDSKNSQSTAEKVLLGLEKAGPDRPQVFYLLGQLREAQRRFPEACAYYRKAVEMDPGYLDAWMQVHSLADRAFLPQDERDAIRLEMFKLDPLGRHARVDLDEVGDLRKLWAAIQAAPRLKVETPKRLLPLVASAARIKEAAKGRRGEEGGVWSYGRYFDSQTRQVPEPGVVIAGNDVVRQILDLMETSSASTTSSGLNFDFDTFY